MTPVALWLRSARVRRLTLSEAPALAITDVSKSFNGVTVLDQVSLAVRAGSAHALVGHNGSGKSALIKVLSGYHSPDAGGEASVVVNRVLEGKGNFGFNAANDTYGDMIEMGILDPTKVTRTALQNAASVASLMLTTEAMVAEKPKDDEPKMPAGGGGMGGMGGMGM